MSVRLFGLLLAVGAPACEPSGNSNGDGGTDGNSSAGINIKWSVITAFIQAGGNNGYTLTCQQAGATEIKFTTTDEQGSHASQVTMVPCPAASNSGEAVLDLPADSVGPYSVSGVLEGVPASRSDVQCGLTSNSDPVRVNLYAEGCDQGLCLATCL